MEIPIDISLGSFDWFQSPDFTLMDEYSMARDDIEFLKWDFQSAASLVWRLVEWLDDENLATALIDAELRWHELQTLIRVNDPSRNPMVPWNRDRRDVAAQEKRREGMRALRGACRVSLRRCGRFYDGYSKSAQSKTDRFRIYWKMMMLGSWDDSRRSCA